MKNTIAIFVVKSYLYLCKTVFLLCLVCSLVVSACTPSPQLTSTPIAIPTIVPSRPCELTSGETIPLAVTGVHGTGVVYSWSSSAGVVIPPDGPAVSYTASNITGDVIISVVAQKGDQTSNGMIICKVVAPITTSTPTVIPSTNTPLPTPTLVPSPIACDHPSITKNVFPQLETINGQHPFYGLTKDVNFLCQGVYDISHTDPTAVRLEYNNIGKNYGFWGIEMPKGYDATKFSEICFWVYTQDPNQSFRLKLKELSKNEKGVLIITGPGKEWIQSCTALIKFADQGIQLDKLLNVNLGFEEPSGSAIVWVDDFEFR